MKSCVQGNLRAQRRLVGVIYPCKTSDLATSRFGVHSFPVALLAYLQWSVDKHFDEVAVPNHVAHVVARGSIGTYGRAYDGASVPDDFRCDKPHSAIVCIPVISAEAKSPGKVGPHHVAIQDGNLPAVFQEQDRQHFGNGGLAGAAQPGEPNTDPLAVTRRVGFG